MIFPLLIIVEEEGDDEGVSKGDSDRDVTDIRELYPKIPINVSMTKTVN